MSVEEPQKVSMIINEGTDPITENAELEDANSNDQSKDSDEENIVLFDTTSSLIDNEPKILTEANTTISELRLEIVKLTTERDQLVKDQTTGREREKSLQEIAKELEDKCFNQQELIESLQAELEKSKEKWQSKLTSMCNELGAKLNQATKKCQESSKEKDAAIAKILVLEKNKRTLIEDNDMLNRKHKEAMKESETSKSRCKGLKTESSKLQTTIEKLEASMREKAEEHTKTRDEIGSANVKLKWAQNKLKSETEAHKEVQTKLTSALQKLQEAKEEGEQIRNDMKAMIVAYQDSEEMKSSTLDVKLKETEKELQQHEKEIADQMELYEINKKELNSTKLLLEEYLQANRTLKDKAIALEQSLRDQERSTEQVHCENNRLKEEAENLNKQISSLEAVHEDLERAKIQCASYEESLNSQKQVQLELENDIVSFQEKDRELLTFSEKLTSLSAELQATKDSLTLQVVEKTSENDQLKEELLSLKQLLTSVQQELTQAKQESEDLKLAVIDKSKAVEQLSISLGEKANDIVVARRKQAGSVRDLQKQLAECKRYIELHQKQRQQRQRDSKEATAQRNGPLSCDRVQGKPVTKVSISSPPPSIAGGQDGFTSAQAMSPDKAVLVEKLVKSRKEIAKRDERIEHLEDHIRQLTEELEKRSIIIKSYLLREESGALSTPEMDINKAIRSRRGGVMASLFRSRANSGDMSLELSLEINQKLQAILEDTILKNITLKDNIKTLGDQIAFLTQHIQR